MVVWFIAVALAPFALAQGVVSSGLTGLVRDTSGKAIANATVSAVHTPTGTNYSATSSESGRYNFRGLVVGGPYTVSVTAGGFKGVERNDVMTALGLDVDVPFVLEPSSVVVMEKYLVKDAVLALDAGATGAGSLLDRDRLLLQPTAQRSFADLARTNAMVTLRNVFGDRQEGMLAAVGTNNRFNSVMLDGARINESGPPSVAPQVVRSSNGRRHHRLSVRYNETVGNLPQFGRYGTTGAFSNPILSAAIPATTAGTLNSQWSPNLKTEIKYSDTSYEQLTTTPVVMPEVRIMGVSGVNTAGANISTGSLAMGLEQFRHGNAINVATKAYSGNADYFWKNFTFTGGFDREESEFANLFRQSSFGIFDYASISDFVADRPAAFSRSFYVQGTPAAEGAKFSDTGLFGQAKWEVNSRLTLTGGVRTDLIDSPKRPLFNQAFSNTFGMRNDGSVDGVQTVSPRLAFNWALDSDRTMQLRGGVGRFAGRSPFVFISNAYGNTGVGRFSVTQATTPAAPATVTTLTSYLRNNFDPAKPIGLAPSDGDPTARRGIALLQDGLKLPSVWRGSLAIDRKVPALGLNLSAEAVFTQTDTTFFSDNLNIKPLVVTAQTDP